MFAITAIAVNRVTGAPEYFLVRMSRTGEDGVPQLDANPGVVYNWVELLDLLDALGNVVVLREGMTPLEVRMTYGTHGYRYIETVENGRSIDALRRLPRFAFVNEAKRIDLTRLHAINDRLFEHGTVIPDDAVQRYVDHGWVRRGDDGPSLTELGRALLAYAKP
jgi:hypothetical protein